MTSFRTEFRKFSRKNVQMNVCSNEMQIHFSECDVFGKLAAESLVLPRMTVAELHLPLVLNFAVIPCWRRERFPEQIILATLGV